MESNEIRDELREAERAAAAPFVEVPRYQWWHTALLSLVGPLFALVTSQVLRALDGGGTLAFIPGFAITLITLFVVLDQRRRSGATPKGKAPAELRIVFRWYYIGAAIVLVSVAILALTTSPWASLPVSYAVCLGGLLWFGTAYQRAAARVQARLA